MKDLDFKNKWLDNLITPERYNEEEIKDYIIKWIDLTVTFEEWHKYRKLDHWQEIEYYNLTEEKIEEIKSFQEGMFIDSVKEFVNFKIEKFKRLHESIQIEVINDSLKVIDEFTQSTKFNSIIYDSIITLVSFRKNDFNEVLKAYRKKLTENVRIHSNLRDKYIINQLDTYLDSPNYTANKIYYFRKALIELKNELLLPPKNSKQAAKIKLAQIALIHIYKEEQITRDNGNVIAKEYGYTAKTSGDKLYQYYNKYYRPTDRIGNSGSSRKNNNKIKLIESIIEFLPKDKQVKAKDEISILENIVEMN